MSMNGKAGNFGDVPKHFILTELVWLKLQNIKEDESFCFFDAFGGNYISDNCQYAAKNFYINLIDESNKSNNLINSIYFRIMKEKMWEKEFGKKYFGSTKWVEEVISLTKIKNYKIIYNSYDLNDVVTASTLVFSSSSFRKEHYNFQMANAYKISQDYRRAIISFDKGIILIDPYWKKNDHDEINCNSLIEHIIREISHSKGWSILVWMPIYTKRYIELSEKITKSIEIIINKENNANNLEEKNKVNMEIFKFQYSQQLIENQKDPQNIKGVHLFLISTQNSNKVHFSQIGINKIGEFVKGKTDKHCFLDKDKKCSRTYKYSYKS